MTLIIPFHSFSDCITNSSSESYVCATKNTIKTVFQLIDSVTSINVPIQGVVIETLKAESLFDINLLYQFDLDEEDLSKEAKSIGMKAVNSYGTFLATEKQVKKLDKFARNRGDDEDSDSYFSYDKVTGGNDTPATIVLSVEVKEGLSPEVAEKAKKIAKLIESFIDTYEIESFSQY
jgi:hypothetical protein